MKAEKRPPKNLIDCFCDQSDDDDDDCLFVRCKVCGKYQHGECVNINHFTELPQGYVCFQCKEMDIECPCGVEGDYRMALARCTVCGMYQHKRHAGLGFGVIPGGYVCKRWRKSGVASAIKMKPVKPVMMYLPKVPNETELRPIGNCAHRVPAGRLLTRLSQFSGRVNPMEMIATLYSEFRDMFFKVHPSLRLFKYLDFKPKECVDETMAFFYFFVRGVSFMTGLPTTQTVLILNHLMAIDIYKRPIPPVGRAEPEHALPQVSKYQRHIAFSERADFTIDSLKMSAVRGALELPRLAVAPDGRGSVTVVSLSNVKSGSLICEVFGEVSLFEELDRESVPPKFSQYAISGTPLMIDSSKYENSVVYSRIRRSLYYNCEVRLFTINDRVRVGIFATSPSILPSLFETQKKIEATAIKSGDELFLPFDIAPVIPKYEGDWRSSKGRKMDMDLDIFRPTRPPIVTAAQSARVAREKEQCRAEEQRKHVLESVGTLVTFLNDDTPFYFEIASDDDTTPAQPRPRRLPQFISKLNRRGLKPFARPEAADAAPAPSFWFSSIPDQEFQGPTEQDLL